MFYRPSHTSFWGSGFSLSGSLSSAQPWPELGIYTWIHLHTCPCWHPGVRADQCAVVTFLWHTFEMPISARSLNSSFSLGPGAAFALFIWLFLPSRFLPIIPGCKLELLKTASSFPVTGVLFCLIYWSKTPFNGALVAPENGCPLSNCLIASWAWLGYWATSRVLFLFISYYLGSYFDNFSE